MIETGFILFLDEITSAPPTVSAAAYQLILDRRLGDYVVPEGWVIFAAGNRQI
jgi:MoxR-like ATPase